MSEDLMQSRIWKRLWNEYPQLRRHIWHVPNQGSSQREGTRLKAMGVLEGVWDLHMFYRGRYDIFELKMPGRELTRDRIIKGKKHFGQKEWGEIMQQHGAITHVCRSEDEFFGEIEEILKRSTL